MPPWKHTTDTHWKNHPEWQRRSVEELLEWIARGRPEPPPNIDYTSPIGKFYLARRKTRPRGVMLRRAWD